MSEEQNATEKNKQRGPVTPNRPVSRLIGGPSAEYGVGWKKTRGTTNS